MNRSKARDVTFLDLAKLLVPSHMSLSYAHQPHTATTEWLWDRHKAVGHAEKVIVCPRWKQKKMAKLSCGYASLWYFHKPRNSTICVLRTTHLRRLTICKDVDKLQRCQESVEIQWGNERWRELVEMDSLESTRRKPVSRGPQNVPRRKDLERLRSLEKRVLGRAMLRL